MHKMNSFILIPFQDIYNLKQNIIKLLQDFINSLCNNLT